MRILAVLAASAAVAVSGCSGSSTPDQQPVEFLEALFGQLYRGEHGAAWESLSAEHQSVVTRQRYVACERNAPDFPGQFEGVEVLRAGAVAWSPDERWPVAAAADHLAVFRTRSRSVAARIPFGAVDVDWAATRP